MAAVVSEPVSASESARVRKRRISSLCARSARSIGESLSAFFSPAFIFTSSTSQMTSGTYTFTTNLVANVLHTRTFRNRSETSATHVFASDGEVEHGVARVARSRDVGAMLEERF